MNVKIKSLTKMKKSNISYSFRSGFTQFALEVVIVEHKHIDSSSFIFAVKSLVKSATKSISCYNKVSATRKTF